MEFKKKWQALLLCGALLGALVGCSEAQEITPEPAVSTEVEITAVDETATQQGQTVDTTQETVAETTAQSVEEAIEETAPEVVEEELEELEQAQEPVEAAAVEEVEVVDLSLEEALLVESDEMMDIDLSVVPTTSAPAISVALMPVASGTVVYENTKAVIDASNTSDGYVMIKSVEDTTATLKVIVSGPSGTPYYYNLTNSGAYEVFPLSDGNGTYQVQVCKNVTGSSYAISQSATLSVSLKDQFAPFLLPNQYVNYSANSNIVSVASQLVAGKSTELEKIQAVYTYVVSNLTYDRDRAATVASGYLPNLDSVLAEKKGICFDYAALMTGMLRSQGIPCKLVVGYAGTAYHAWISTYSTTGGWMDGAIYFDGTTWKLMDPTFASSANSSDSIMEYIGNGANYSAMYLY